MNDDARKLILNAGCGSVDSGRLPACLVAEQWREVRLDIDQRTAPDLVGSFTDMHGLVQDAQFDAIYSSHAIEHLHTHEVVPALREFRRVIKPNGFVLLTCPDLAAIARQLLKGGSEGIAYHSPAGPIRPIDMLFGHAQSIANGRTWMAHRTGFTAERLARVILDSGFPEVRVMHGENFDLWAIALAPEASVEQIAAIFATSNLATLFSPSAIRQDAASVALENMPSGGESPQGDAARESTPPA